MNLLFHRAQDVFGSPLDDSMLLLNANTGKYHGLNPVASRIWELLAEPSDMDTLVARLVEEFEVAADDCQREVSAFLAVLRERGLLISK